MTPVTAAAPHHHTRGTGDPHRAPTRTTRTTTRTPATPAATRPSATIPPMDNGTAPRHNPARTNTATRTARQRRILLAALAFISAISLSTTLASTAHAAAPSDVPLSHGDKSDTVGVTQQRLTWLGYSLRDKETDKQYYGRSTRKAVKAFQTKFFLNATGKVNRKTWRTLNKVGSNIGDLPKSCREENKVLCIDKTAKLLRYVRKGKVVQTLDVRFGVPGLDTPTGTYRVWYRDRDATSGINGPDAPRVPMPYALFFNGDIAVHYSSTFARDGYYPGGGSHGCVNVADYDGVAWLFDQIPEGTRVVVYTH